VVTSSTLGKQYEMGHYIVAGTDVYVSRGIGLEGMGAPRLRLLCPPEITLCTLRGAKKAPESRSSFYSSSEKDP